MSKLPAIQFYPADWRKDPGVQALDFEARGVWFEILCLMHESDRRGVLLLNGAAMPDDALARLLGVDSVLLKQILSKIEAYGVASREKETGALICRRMIRDEHIREVRSKAGSLGAKSGHFGGRPVLPKQNASKTPANEPAKRQQNNPPSSSSSSSSSDSTTAIAVGADAVASAAGKKTELSDEEWLRALEADAAYQGIPVRVEYGKCRAWCEVNRKQLSRRRFVNWLNRVERPMVKAAGSHQSEGRHVQGAW